MYNAGAAPVDLSGWSIGTAGSAYVGSVDLVGTIGAGETFVVDGPNSEAGNGSPVFDQALQFSPSIQNSGATADGVALYDVPSASITAATVPVDAVIYGGSNTSNLIDETGAAGAVDVGDAPSGSSIERVDLVGAWQIQAAPTPNGSPLVDTALSIDVIQVIPGVWVKLRITTSTTQDVSVTFSETLRAGTWAELGQFEVSPPNEEITITGVTAPAGFFRVAPVE